MSSLSVSVHKRGTLQIVLNHEQIYCTKLRTYTHEIAGSMSVSVHTSNAPRAIRLYALTHEQIYTALNCVRVLCSACGCMCVQMY